MCTVHMKARIRAKFNAMLRGAGKELGTGGRGQGVRWEEGRPCRQFHAACLCHREHALRAARHDDHTHNTVESKMSEFFFGRTMRPFPFCSPSRNERAITRNQTVQKRLVRKMYASIRRPRGCRAHGAHRKDIGDVLGSSRLVPANLLRRFFRRVAYPHPARGHDYQAGRDLGRVAQVLEDMQGRDCRLQRLSL